MLKSLYKSGNTFLLVALLSLTYFWGSAQGTLEQTKSIDYYYKEALRYRHQNQLAPAMEALGKAERIAEKKEDLKALLDTHHKFALLYLEMEDRESTLFYWDRAGIILKTLEYPYGEAVQAFIDAAIKFYDGNSFQAMNVLAEAKNLNNDKNLRNNILLLEADILQKIDKLGDASKNYNALLVNSDDQERAYLSTKAHLGLAALHQKQNKPEESIKNGQAALRLARKKSFQREILSAYNLLAAAYKQSGDFERALSFNANINNIKDSIFNIKKMQLEVQTAEKIRVAQQARTIAKLEAENEELSASANRSEITAILTSAFLVIISILSVSLFRNNQIKLRTNDLLQTKNTELEQARDEAISAMEAKSNFLSTVTHELRTPLYAVTGLTHLLLEENPSEHQKEHLKSLKFSGDYLLNFINDILQINKIDADKLEPL
ncbi:MAG: histidine kinase dimerization/phospho-acceptor domain-containing protein, partial [Bacteroidota bacterium]